MTKKNLKLVAKDKPMQLLKHHFVAPPESTLTEILKKIKIIKIIKNN